MSKIIRTSENKENLANSDSLYITNTPIVNNCYSIYLTDTIGEYEKYRELFNLLRQAETTDVFIMYMNNFGGYVHTGIEIMSAMNACKGQVYTVLTGPVYSMAPLIALTGDKVFVDRHVFMMFHDYSGGTGGKGSEQEKAILNDKPFFNDLFSTVTKGFLTAKETKSILYGTDLYLNREDVVKRLKKLKKFGNQESCDTE